MKEVFQPLRVVGHFRFGNTTLKLPTHLKDVCQFARMGKGPLTSCIGIKGKLEQVFVYSSRR